jgi:hypothetical protein
MCFMMMRWHGMHIKIWRNKGILKIKQIKRCVGGPHLLIIIFIIILYHYLKLSYLIKII